MASKNFNLRSLEQDDRTVFWIEGGFTIQNEYPFSRLLAACRCKKKKLIILDLVGLESISSSGLGMLLLANVAASEAGNELIFRNPHGSVLDVLNLMRFDEVIKME